jgi:hypothetical protein
MAAGTISLVAVLRDARKDESPLAWVDIGSKHPQCGHVEATTVDGPGAMASEYEPATGIRSIERRAEPAQAFAACPVVGIEAQCSAIVMRARSTTALQLLLLFAGGNGRYCGLAIVAEIGEGISDASHFLDAPTFGPALLFYVRAACFSRRCDLGQSCLAHVGKVCDTLLEASGNAEVSRFDVCAGFFDILRARTQLRHRARHGQE